MVVTNPWLAGPSPTTPLQRDRLEERILNLLSSQNVCPGHRRPPRTVGNPLVGQASSRGAQVFGNARILEPRDDDFEQYWSVVRWQSDHVERSRSLDDPPVGTIGVVPAERIVYTEHWLRREGYAPRQFWRPAPSRA